MIQMRGDEFGDEGGGNRGCLKRCLGGKIVRIVARLTMSMRARARESQQ